MTQSPTDREVMIDLEARTRELIPALRAEIDMAKSDRYAVPPEYDIERAEEALRLLEMVQQFYQKELAN